MLKILVLGFDGASPELIDKWIKDLPTFRKLKNGLFQPNREKRK